MRKIASLNFVYHKVKTRFSCLFCRLLNNRISHDTIFIHQVAEELWAQADSILCSWVLWKVFFEENSEPWVSIEPLGAEVTERVAIGNIY